MSSGDDPFKYFRVEAREILEALGRGLLEIEKEPSVAVVGRLLRLAHTLKGAARVVKQPKIAEHAHAIEEALAPLRTGELHVERDVIRDLLALVDAVASEVKRLDPPREPVQEQAGPAPQPVETVRADVAEMDNLLDGIAETSVQVRALRQMGDATTRARRVADLVLDQLARSRTPDGASQHRLRSLAEDLRGAVAQIEQRLGSGIDVVERELADVRRAAERLRLVSMASMFAVLERTAHDAAQLLDTRVSFATRGEDIRIDSHVLGAVQGALVQLVRNAVAHGIEPAGDRIRAGKPVVGRVEVSAARRDGRVVFMCSDDGRGFDVEAVRRGAVSFGTAPHVVEAMQESALLELLFRGGVTTSRTVTEVAGRGIGLDVVRDAAAALGGDVRVQNHPGRGASVELAVPISLSSLDALLVVAGTTTAAIPLDAVRRTTRLGSGDVTETSAGESVVSEGKVIPLLTLARSLAGRDSAVRSAASPVVIVEAAAGSAAVRVDRLVSIANVVVRPLPRVARADSIVVGAALDAEGVPQLVLDPANLVAAALRGHPAKHAHDEPRPLPVLVIDDSLTTRRLEQSILESAGYEVHLASSAEEGLSKARSTRYAIFLVDVEMPGMSGFEFIEQTRMDPTLRDVPAILVTSRSAPEDRQRATEVGARGFIAKGEFDQTELLALIRRLQG